MTRWSRSRACSGRARASSSARRSAAGPARPPARASRCASSASSVVGAQQLDPGRLLGAELAQAQLAAVGDAHEQPRRAVARAGALVEELQAPGAHEVHEQHEVAADVDDEVLAAPPHAGRSRDPSSAYSGGSNVFSALMPGASADSIVRAAQRRVQPPRGDLDLGKLGHPAVKATPSGPAAQAGATELES